MLVHRMANIKMQKTGFEVIFYAKASAPLLILALG